MTNVMVRRMLSSALGILGFASISLAAPALKSRLVKSAVSPNGPSIEVQFDLPNVDISEDDSGYIGIRADGLKNVQEIGKPETPTAGFLFAVPPGHEARLVIEKETRKNQASRMPRPFQKKTRCAPNDKDAMFEIDHDLYASNAIYPEVSAKIENVGDMQGLKLARLAVYPVRVDFAAQELSLTTSLKARIEFVPVKGKAQSLSMSPAFLEMAQAATVNAKALKSVRRNTTSERMLVVTVDAFKDELTSWLAWKRARGMTVDLVTFTEAGGTREKLKEYIQAYYDRLDPKPTYLMFVGNGKILTPYNQPTSSGTAASDYPYTLLSGDDIVPDMLVGRLLGDTAAEIQVQMNKWMTYEKNPEENDWFKKGTTIASDEGQGPSDVEYAQSVEKAMTDHTYSSVDHFYQGENTATPANISAAINEGRSWLTYIGHGSGTSWGSTNGSFSNTSIKALTNTRMPVIVDVACLNGSFVRMQTCFGKQWVTHTGTGNGAVGYYGASVSTSWDPPAVMAVGAATRHFEQHISSLAGTMVAGQLYLIEQMGTTADVIDNLEWYNLLGDASMLMRTDTPNKLSVVASVVDEADGSHTVSAAVNNAEGAASAGVSVALTDANGSVLHGFGVSDAEGHVSITVPAETNLSGAKVTASGYNFDTQEAAL